MTVFLASAENVIAQAPPPQPVVTFVFPAGAARGQTVEATINGRDFQNASGVRITGTGVTANIVQVVNPNAVRISVAVAPDAACGERELRLLTPGGISNRLRFLIGALPEINEVEPNTDRAQTQLLPSLPVLVNGQILDNDRDNFRFAAKAGETIVVEVQARSLLAYLPDTVPGFLDTCLNLFDANNRLRVSVDRFRHKPDSMLMYAIPQDGEYRLEISDIIYRGRGDFIYRLSIGVVPYVTHVFPLGCQRGSTAHIELHGVNLPAPAMDIAVPADSPVLRFVGPVTGALPTNILPLAVGEETEAVEAEPNDGLPQANRVGIPVSVNGRIQQAGDVDHFLIAAQANQVLMLDVRARRLDSPLDSFVTVMNAQGGALVENDDFVDPDYPLVLHHADSRLVYTFPAAGDYLIRIRDTQGKGGDEYAYRLLMAPPQPDCVLRTVPDMQRVAKGDSVVVPITAERRNGFDREVNLTVQNLPPGFSASDAVIPPGQSQAKLTITAPPDAPLTAFAPQIVASATIDNRTWTRTVSGAEDVMQAFSYRHVIPTSEFVVAVVETSLFTLSTNVSPVEGLQIKPGTESQLVVKVARKEGAKFPVNLAVVDAPAGLSVKLAPLPAEQNEATISIAVPPQAPVGQKVNVILNGTMSTDKETATRTAPAIAVKILSAQ